MMRNVLPGRTDHLPARRCEPEISGPGGNHKSCRASIQAMLRIVTIWVLIDLQGARNHYFENQSTEKWRFHGLG